MRSRSIVILVSSVAALALAGCGSTSPSGDASASDEASDVIAVVASTNVWGDIAATVGGDAVSVTSIIDNPDRDPHEYEADAQNQLALSKAAVVIENGGGYDDFMDTMLSAAGNEDAIVINAVDVSGKEAEEGEELNEHVWYDFGSVQAVIDAVEAAYSQLQPEDADTFRANAEELKGEIDGLVSRTDELSESYAGEPVAITEPVPLYLLEAIGLENKTPEEFSEAIEEDTDVAPAVLQETLALFTDHEVRLLAYNEQTTGPQTEAVLTAAQDNDIPVVPVTEILPAGDTYVSWMGANLDALADALGS